MLKLFRPVSILVLVSILYLSVAHANQKGNDMTITLTIDDEILTAEIEDSPVGHDFLSLLPITLTLNDYASTEKVANLPKRLNIEQADDGFTPVIGDIAYYAPWGNLAIFYQDFSYSKGLVKIGKLRGSIDKLLKEDPFEVQIDKAGP
ncbi:cyclophilin-like fold protein [Bartonella sp. HY329]|uniref:cyclophilin-like fold protein n=1 Tax=unclassified Bartonella TaxID=2645622 RepID=UPI0021C7F6DC|nr:MULTISPECIES: cyclophilin-like fold protein [unclassified Bartonella]UXM94467.1 cyclophilin-like fold protein [Bartonella sp. HY329]UXN08791.1 cyclophilin-like fold protein [Bartonella sp. HY328]